jgi:hypothetical protein
VATTTKAPITVWSSANGATDLSDVKWLLSRFRWDYMVTIDREQPCPRNPATWLQEFHDSINTVDLFPCNRRFTSEPPGWLPILHGDEYGHQILRILLALPPGALERNLATYEVVSELLTKAVHQTFHVNSKVSVQMVNDTKIESLEHRLRVASFELVGSFVRDHHRKCINR